MPLKLPGSSDAEMFMRRPQSKMGVSRIGELFSGPDMFSNIVGMITGGGINPMSLIGFGSPFSGNDYIRRAMESNARVNIPRRSKGMPGEVGTYGTPAGRPVQVWEGVPGRVSPIYRDDKGLYWSPTNDGRWRRVNYNPPSGGFPETGGSDPATGRTGRLGPIDPDLPGGLG